MKIITVFGSLFNQHIVTSSKTYYVGNNADLDITYFNIYWSEDLGRYCIAKVFEVKAL